MFLVYRVHHLFWASDTGRLSVERRPGFLTHGLPPALPGLSSRARFQCGHPTSLTFHLAQLTCVSPAGPCSDVTWRASLHTPFPRLHAQDSSGNKGRPASQPHPASGTCQLFSVPFRQCPLPLAPPSSFQKCRPACPGSSGVTCPSPRTPSSSAGS